MIGMSKLVIHGGSPLEGMIPVNGAKNSVLPILAATLINGGINVLHNCPDLRDVSSAIKILEHLGCRVKREGKDIIVDSSVITRWDVPDSLMREMRSSVIFLGPILARCGQALLHTPGGCELGPRPIDLHLDALRKLGAEIEQEGGATKARAADMRGRDIILAFPSVGATENIMLAATACRGMTRIINAAREPEIVDLQQFLKKTGASVNGAGAGGDVTVTDCEPEHIGTVIEKLADGGAAVTYGSHSVRIRMKDRLSAMPYVRTMPYPGFPTDCQAQLMAAACTARGTTVFLENIFENRYRHTDELIRMGADIRVSGRVAVVEGKILHGADMLATDLRGGAAMVVAALAAKDKSTIGNISHIDRGYERIEEKLSAIGADIAREQR